MFCGYRSIEQFTLQSLIVEVGYFPILGKIISIKFIYYNRVTTKQPPPPILWNFTNSCCESFTTHNSHCTKMKFSMKDFFSKCKQISKKLRICLNLLKKFFMENFVFCTVYVKSVCIYKDYRPGRKLVKMVDKTGENFGKTLKIY